MVMRPAQLRLIDLAWISQGPMGHEEEAATLPSIDLSRAIRAVQRRGAVWTSETHRQARSGRRMVSTEAMRLSGRPPGRRSSPTGC